MINICITSLFDILDPAYGAGARVRGLISGLSESTEIGKIVIVYPFAKDFHSTNFDVHTYLSHRSFDLLKAIHNVSIVDEINPFRNTVLLRMIREFDVSILQNESIWGGLSSNLVCKYCNIPLVIDEHNFEAEYTKEVKRHRLIQLYSKWLELNVTKAADQILTVSEEDKLQISRIHGINPSKTVVVPNGVDCTEFRPSSVQKVKARSELHLNGKFVLVFHGSLDYGPNREAATNINDFLLPRITRSIPNAFFLIVGRNPPQFLHDSHFLKFTGYVPNLSDYLAAGDIAIVPLLRGGGTKLKLLDYLAMGIPIVATRKAVEGLPIQNGVHALLSEGIDEEFVGNILALYNDHSLREKLSVNCRKLAEQYDWRRIAKNLVPIYRRILKE